MIFERSMPSARILASISASRTSGVTVCGAHTVMDCPPGPAPCPPAPAPRAGAPAGGFCGGGVCCEVADTLTTTPNTSEQTMDLISFDGLTSLRSMAALPGPCARAHDNAKDSKFVPQPI